MRSIHFSTPLRKLSVRSPNGPVPATAQRSTGRPARRVGAVAVLLGLTAALLAGTASPASAAIITVRDGFEGTQAANWSFSHVGNGTGGLSSLQTHTGVRDGFISMRSAGFSSVGRRVQLPATTSCTAGIWVNPVLATQQINFEIIEPNSFTYVALKTVVLSGSAPYTFVSTQWNHGPRDVLVRVSLIGNSNGTQLGTWVDDLGILCHT
ncbi:hypothetical protein [Plantactinospora soyae]|uniref:Uncharacterized protein n=1 Tax=Plantactinospora soyae TaxID=1544732 RepID=A0A927R539_9ACTN|nr:hypothetical protein [Plantactinospora soyae]MBE1487139.1 hypothetical protein [Plantactinospora soyae]